jgi:integrase
MPRKPRESQIVCDHFRWRLFVRGRVFYADGRNAKRDLGKHSLGTRSSEDALHRLRELDHQKAIELGLIAPTVANVAAVLALSDGWERYLSFCKRTPVLCGVSNDTHKRYRAVRDKHLTFCQSKAICNWNQVDKASVVEYGNWLTDADYAYRTVYLELNLIKSANRWLIEQGLLAADRRILLRLRKPQGSDAYCYTTAEVAAIVGHCRTVKKLNWLANIIVGLACTGLRISELGSLRWTDLAPDKSTLRLADERASSRRAELGAVRTTKGRRSRSLPIHPDLRRVLQSLLVHVDGRIFHGPKNGKLKPDTVRNIFVRDVIQPLKDRFPTPADEIGFEHGRLHSFRHYFCSQAFLGGASEADIKDWLGHQDSKMVAHYRHLRSEDSQRKMQQINFLGPIDSTERSAG